MNQFRTALKNDNDEGFALLSVILLMTVVTFFAIVLLGLAVSQTGPTLLTNKNSRTQTAAQAGVDAAVAQLRNAQSLDSGGVMMGDIHKLPCTVEGTVDGTGGATRYSATVQYFSDDPSSQSDAWRTANAIRCYTGTGNNGGIRAVAHFALIESQGLDDSATAKAAVANRIIQATYIFQLTTRKVSGGQIMDRSGQYCLVATGTSAGSTIRYQDASSVACATATDYNSWSWRDDYMLHLSATDLGGGTPYCLSGRPNPNAVKATLKQCTTSSADPDGQRWRWTGQYTWQGQDPANTSQSGVAAYVVNQDDHPDAGDYLYVSPNLGWQSLTPMGAVGKAAASYATHQVVNQTYFGRCLDVTNGTIWYGYMIAYPCKQDPSGGLNFDWNHKWYYAEPDLGVPYVDTQISVINGSTYCLIPTNTTGLKSNSTDKSITKTYSVRFPRFVTGDKNGYALNCDATKTTWRRYGYNTDYSKAYTFYDATNNLCLSAAGPFITEDGDAGRWTSIIEEPCDGSDNQKWNVPDTPVTASVGDYQETTGR